MPDNQPIPGAAPTPFPATLQNLYNVAQAKSYFPEQEREEPAKPTFVEHTERAAQDAVISLLQQIPEPIKKPLRQAVGRVAVNTVEPVGYGAGALTGANKSKLGDVLDEFRYEPLQTIRDIVHDQPNWSIVMDSLTRARRPLFREFFDLPPEPDPYNMYIRQGKHYRLNPQSTNPVVRDTYQQFIDPQGASMKSYIQGGYPGFAHNQISGNYKPGYPDPWDFDVHKDELAAYRGHPLSTTDFMRQAMQAIGKPAVLETGGYSNPDPEKEYDYSATQWWGYRPYVKDEANAVPAP